MNKLLILIPILLATSLHADKERERWEREFREKELNQKELRTVYYKVATVSAVSTFISGSLAAWLFYYIQSKRE